MKKILLFLLIFISTNVLSGCATGGRVSTQEGDSMLRTDKWTRVDSENAVKSIMEQFESNATLNDYIEEVKNRTGSKPKLFIKDVDNDTSDTNFRINELNNILLKELNQRGTFKIVNRRNASKINDELAYQRKGTVKSSDIQSAVKESGADLLIFGQISGQPVRQGKQKIIEYTLNMTITHVESKEELAIADFTTTKYVKAGFSF